jgi:hypothetical protein
MQSGGLTHFSPDRPDWLVKFDMMTDREPVEFVATCEGMEGIFTAAPVERAPRVGALIIAGSGPTDANGNNRFSGRSDNLRLIAHALALRGIASLRYDKRGVGRSAAGAPPEEAMTIESSLKDAGHWAR